MNETDRVCSRCGQHYVAAEATDAQWTCPECEPKLVRHNLQLVNPDAATQVGEGHSVSDIESGPILPPAGDANATRSYRGPIRQVGHVSPLWGIVGFIIPAAILMGLLYAQKTHQLPLDYYLWTRIGAWALFYVCLLISAFRDSPTTGWMTLCLPPYTAYFALERVNLFWLRGMFLALCLTLGFEVFWAREHSILLVTQEKVNQMIQGGHDALQNAGESAPERIKR